MSLDTVAQPATLAHRHVIDERLWNRLVRRLGLEHGYDQQFAERVMDQTLGFLRLIAAESTANYSPSAMVDDGWHTFILFTRDYAEFCQRVAGFFIHHVPTDEDLDGTVANVLLRTVAGMKVHGLAVDEALWDGAVGECGGQKCHTCVN